jgi:hypothetical protein
MRFLIFTLLSTLSVRIPASPCINYYGKNIKGEGIETDDSQADPAKFLRELTLHPEHDAIKKSDLGPEPAADADFKIRNDYAANLIRQGKTKRAIEILESIEKSRPGEYRVAANLGTAYELSGDVDRAFRWISEGLNRYPDVHLQTEWLHLRILEVKHELAKDPTWLKTHSVLDFDFGTGAVPILPPAWGKKGQEAVLSALRYQLHERLAFVSPPDPIVGELLGVYADYTALTSPAEYALPLYDLALSFKPTHADLLEKRRAQASTMTPSMFEEIPDEAWVVALAGLGAALFCSIMYRRLLRRPPPDSGPRSA